MMKQPSVVTRTEINLIGVHKLFASKGKQSGPATLPREKNNAVSRWFYISLTSAACSDVYQTLLETKWTRPSKYSDSH